MSAPKPHNPAFLALVNDAKSRIQEIDIVQYTRLRAADEEHVLIDTREESEWAAGHAAGALHLGKGIIERAISQSARRARNISSAARRACRTRR